MSFFDKIKNRFPSKQNQNDVLSKYHSYEEIQKAPLSEKIQIASNYLNQSNSTCLDLCELVKHNKIKFNTIHKISIVARSILLAKEYEFDVPESFWKSINIDVVAPSQVFEMAYYISEFFLVQEKTGQFCQLITLSLDERNLTQFFNNLSINIRNATINPNLRNMMWLPSTHYMVFSNLFEQEASLGAYLLLGFSFGIPQFIKYYHEVSAEQIKSCVQEFL